MCKLCVLPVDHIASAWTATDVNSINNVRRNLGEVINRYPSSFKVHFIFHSINKYSTLSLKSDQFREYNTVNIYIKMRINKISHSEPF